MSSSEGDARTDHLKAQRQYRAAFNAMKAARESAGDDPGLVRQMALKLGGYVEYRLRVADTLRVVPPTKALLERLEEAIAIDDSVADLHWDQAVIHARFTGSNEQAQEALSRAE